MRQIRTLHDGQLDTPAGVFGEHQLSIEQVIELGVIGHFQEHLASIQAAVADNG